jgi:protein-S-isoprenylcysteine O-methyltransferase Ste14
MTYLSQTLRTAKDRLASVVTMTLLVALRIGPEERMMLEEFGKDYQEYVGVTKRLVSGVW